MAQARLLPARPNLSHLKKVAKHALAEARKHGVNTKLAAVQLAIAREYGFASWRKLKAHVESTARTASPEALFDAIRAGDIAAVRKLLDAQPKLVSARTEAGETPLHVAAERNDPAVIELLLKYGADPSQKYGQSAHNALSWALTTMAFDAAKALLKAGVKADLFCSAALGDLDRVKSFFDSTGRVKPNASETGSSRFAPDGTRLPRPPTNPRDVVSDALYIASRNAHANVVRHLLEHHDPDVNFRAYMNGTPLHWAYFGASQEVIQMLLDAGADPTLRDSEFRCTPRAFGICTAANWGIEHLVTKILRADPTLANIYDGRGTPLHEAARAGHPEVVKMLLAAGADASVKDVDGNTPLDLARKFKRDGVIQILESTASGTDLLNEFLEASLVPTDGSDHRGGNLDRANELLKLNRQLRDDFFAACVLGDHKRIMRTLKRGPKLATTPGGPRNWTPLLYVCFSRFMRLQTKRAADFAKCGKLLLNHGANPNDYWSEKYQAQQPGDPNSIQETALYGATGVSNNPALARLLLNAGASVAEKDLESLYHASEHKDNRCLKLILDAKPPAKDVSYCLARKLDFEDLQGARLYLQHGADVNHKTPHGTQDTRLHHAIRRGRSARIIQLLLKHGADLSIRNGEGLTAHQLARRLGHTEAAELVLKHGAVEDLDDRARFVAACTAGDGKTARRLLKAQPDLLRNLAPEDRRLIADAAAAGHLSAVRLMLDLGFDPDAPGDWGGSALHQAAWSGHTRIVQLLLSRGADPNVKQHWGGDALQTAVHGASHASHKNGPLIVGLLIKAMKNRDLAQALEQATKLDNKLVVALIEHAIRKRDEGAVRKSDWKPLMDAAFHGRAEQVKKLLAAGANPDVMSTTAHRYRPLHRAIEFKKVFARGAQHEEVVKVLLAGGADPKRRATFSNVTALQLAATQSPQFVSLLLEHFKPLDIFHAAAVCDLQRVLELLKSDRSQALATDVNGMTALHYAAASAMFKLDSKFLDPQVHIVKMLLDAGVDPMARYLWDGKWPIPVLYHCCGQHDNPAVARVLFEAGATPFDGETVYHASDEGHRQCLDLIDEFADRKKLKAECTKCLRSQMHWGRTRGAKWLLEHGADPNSLHPEFGESALHAAVKRGASKEVIAFLLSHGADPKRKNARGKTAIQLAAGKPRIVEQLQQHLKARAR